MHILQVEAINIFVDNKKPLTPGKNSVFHDQSKHFDTGYHFVREWITGMEFQLQFIKSHNHP